MIGVAFHVGLMRKEIGINNNRNYIQGLQEVNDNKVRIDVDDYFVVIMHYFFIILSFVKRCSWRDY